MKKPHGTPLIFILFLAYGLLLCGCAAQRMPAPTQAQISNNYSPAHKAMLQEHMAEDGGK